MDSLLVLSCPKKKLFSASFPMQKCFPSWAAKPRNYTGKRGDRSKFERTQTMMMKFLFSLSGAGGRRKKSHKSDRFSPLGGGGEGASQSARERERLFPSRSPLRRRPGRWQSLIKGEIRFFPLTALITGERRRRRGGPTEAFFAFSSSHRSSFQSHSDFERKLRGRSVGRSESFLQLPTTRYST